MLLDGEFLSLQEAFTNEVDKPRFIMYEGQIVGKKVKNEVFFDYWNNENLTKLIKFYLKRYHSVPIEDPYNPNRQAFVTIKGQKIYFCNDFATYKGQIHPTLFSKQYTSDFTDLSISYNLLKIMEGERTTEYLDQIYKDIEEQYK
jgi:hypothetical protein